MKNTNIIYGIVGLFIGILITHVFYSQNNLSSRQMTHQMPDGTMMSNVPMDMGNMMDGMMAGLKGKSGDTFDKEFLSEMIVHHQGAVEMARVVLMVSKRPELIKLANDIISAQTKEIAMMQGWQKAWFK